MKAVAAILAGLFLAALGAHLPEYAEDAAAEPISEEEKQHENMMRSFFYAPPGFFSNNPYEMESPILAQPQAPFYGDPLTVFHSIKQEFETNKELKQLYAQQEVVKEHVDGEERFLLPSITLVGNSVSLSSSAFLSLLKRLYSAFTTKTTVVTLTIPVMTTTTVLLGNDSPSSTVVAVQPTLLTTTTENPIDSTDPTESF